jgi:two-component system sensor histidine kinase YesM
MNRIADRDFSRETSIEWDNEFGDIGKGINKLSESIQTLMDSRLDMEKQKRDYEFQMLQSQINPHFLYNTLMSIKWMATIQNAPGIAEMTTSLSRLLKSISKGTTQFVPLSEELELLKDYYTIMKYRYGGTIDMGIHTDDDKLLDCCILRFTLQPIVENAIFHGIEPKGAAGKIEIHIHKNEMNDLQIDITDDGIGMDEETARTLLSEKFESKSSFFKKIGISNVHHRIQLEFGLSYGLSIHSRAGSFTTVSIRLPDKPCPNVSADGKEQ